MYSRVQLMSSPDLPDSPNMEKMSPEISYGRHRYPHCIVWTPIPLLTWLFPFIGHMGIATSNGIIRDFAGPYTVSDDDMAFGWPTRYLQLNVESVGRELWDRSVFEASEEYKRRIHNLCCDNCHSHVAYALNAMGYDGSQNWNMVKLAAILFIRGRYVGFCGFIKTWLPFFIIVAIVISLAVSLNFTTKATQAP